MSNQITTIFIEIPSTVIQQEIWNIEERLKQVEGVATNLQEPKDALSTALLVLQITTSVMGSIATIDAGIKSIHEVAKLIYDFLHLENNKTKEESKKRLAIIKKGKRIEIYNLSLKEVEKILKE